MDALAAMFEFLVGAGTFELPTPLPQQGRGGSRHIFAVHAAVCYQGRNGGPIKGCTNTVMVKAAYSARKTVTGNAGLFSFRRSQARVNSATACAAWVAKKCGARRSPPVVDQPSAAGYP
jgi:hypothetical protein